MHDFCDGADVKKLSRDLLSNREEREHFRQFVEDYNTATMPSKKYYGATTNSTVFVVSVAAALVVVTL